MFCAKLYPNIYCIGRVDMLQYATILRHLDYQSDLDSFQIWCRENVLNLTGSKCKVMTFCRVNPIQTTYTLNGCPLDRITRVDYLGVFLDPKINNKIF